MKIPQAILIVSKNPALMQARKLILGTYFEVETAGRLSEAAGLLNKRDFALVVLCDTLSDPELNELAHLTSLRKPPPSLLSLLSPGMHHQDAVVGRPLLCTKGPLQLLKTCADALGVTLTLDERGHSSHRRPLLGPMLGE